MKCLSLIAVTLLIGAVTSIPAHAACTLDPNPLLNLTGTWAFQLNGVLTAEAVQRLVRAEIRTGGAGGINPIGGGVIAGTFTASADGGRRGGGGTLYVLASTNLTGPGGGVYGASVYPGTFQMDGTCDHGSLQFVSAAPNLGSPYDFFFTNLAKTEMFLIGLQADFIYSGIAKKII